MLDGELPVNHAILGNLQDVFNLLPNLSTPKGFAGGVPHLSASGVANGASSASTEGDNTDLARAMSVKTNDQLMTIYLSSLIRAITAFHDLIENKIQNKQQAAEGEKKLNGVVNGEKKEDEPKKKKGEEEDESGLTEEDKKKGRIGHKDI